MAPSRAVSFTVCLLLASACSPSSSLDAGADDGDGGAPNADAGDVVNDANDDGGPAAVPDAGGCSLSSPACPAAWIQAHNDVRQQLNDGSVSDQPVPDPALPMMGADPLLTQVASEHAARCIWNHNSDRSTRYGELGGSGYVGENMSAASGTGPASPAGVVNGWFSEHASYHYASNTCAGMCGHYTQIAWRSSERVGCASHYCESIEGLSWSGVITVCDYAPGGNFGGDRPY